MILDRKLFYLIANLNLERQFGNINIYIAAIFCNKFFDV